MIQSALLDDVEVMLDDQDGVAEVGEAVEDFDQLAHVVEMQAGGGLVEQVESVSGLALGRVRARASCAGLRRRKEWWRIDPGERSRGRHRSA